MNVTTSEKKFDYESAMETTHLLPPMRKAIKMERTIERPITFTIHDFPMMYSKVLNSPEYKLEASAWSLSVVPPHDDGDDIFTIHLNNLSNKQLTASVSGSVLITFESHTPRLHEHERNEFETLQEDAIAVNDAFSCTPVLVAPEGRITLLANRLTREMLTNCGDLTLSVSIVVYGNIQAISSPEPTFAPQSGPTLGQDLSLLLCIEYTQRYEIKVDAAVPKSGQQSIVTNITHSHHDHDTTPGTELHAKMSDIKLVCGSVTIHAHRAILAARSPVFHKKLTSWTTAVSLFFSKRYRVEGINPAVLVVFISYLYTDMISQNDLAQFGFPLLIVAAKYQVVSLMARCEYFLASGLMTDCAANYLLLAKKLKLHSFASMCEDYIAKNLTEVSAMDPAYIKLDAEECRHLLEKANANVFAAREDLPAEKATNVEKVVAVEPQNSSPEQFVKRNRAETATTRTNGPAKKVPKVFPKEVKVKVPEDLTETERSFFTGDTLLKKFGEHDIAETKEIGPESP